MSDWFSLGFALVLGATLGFLAVGGVADLLAWGVYLTEVRHHVSLGRYLEARFLIFGAIGIVLGIVGAAAYLYG